MEKFETFLVMLVPLSFSGTFLFFVYRYMWFTVNTIPGDRWIVAGFGAVLSWIGFAIYKGVKNGSL